MAQERFRSSPRRMPVQGEGKAASLLGAETRHTALIATFSARCFRHDLGQDRLVQLLRKLGHPHAPTDVGAGHARLHHDRLSFFARQRLAEAALHCLAALNSLNPRADPLERGANRW